MQSTRTKLKELFSAALSLSQVRTLWCKAAASFFCYAAGPMSPFGICGPIDKHNHTHVSSLFFGVLYLHHHCIFSVMVFVRKDRERMIPTWYSFQSRISGSFYIFFSELQRFAPRPTSRSSMRHVVVVNHIYLKRYAYTL